MLKWFVRLLDGTPSEEDTLAVREMTSRQWATIADRTDTYLKGYTDKPGSEDRAQRRSEWIARRFISLGGSSVLELGCGCGRNLAALKRRNPDIQVSGWDINLKAIEQAKQSVEGQFDVVNLYELVNSERKWDVIFTVGVLGHLESIAARDVILWALKHANNNVVLVEEPGDWQVLKGPRGWGADKSTGDYVLWGHNFLDMIPEYSLVWSHELPLDLCAPGATVIYVLKP